MHVTCYLTKKKFFTNENLQIVILSYHVTIHCRTPGVMPADSSGTSFLFFVLNSLKKNPGIFLEIVKEITSVTGGPYGDDNEKISTALTIAGLICKPLCKWHGI